MIGAGLALLGLALLFGQFAFLYGAPAQRALMVTIGLPGVGVLAAAGAVSFACGCLMFAAPHAAADHAGRIARAVRGPARRRETDAEPAKDKAKDWQVAPSRWPAAWPAGRRPPEDPSEP
jgi:hypothetical protein